MSVVKINAIHVPEGGGAELEKRFAARAGTIESTPGFLGFQMLRPTAGESRYFVVTHWVDDAAFQAWMGGQGRAAHSGARAKPVGTGSDVLEFDVVLDVRPDEAGAGPSEDLEG